MSKTLRLGFVMGGGVSLGTFSGAALSETIKQLIVHGRYQTDQKDAMGNPVYRLYDRVEIDVFSGASAGAISLGIMLRILVNHQDKYKQLGYSSYVEMRQNLEKKILGQFGEAAYKMKHENNEKYECLIAAQAVQEFQEKIWAKDVDMNRLLGTGPHQKDLSNIAGLLDRDVVDNLGRTYFQFEGHSNRLNTRILLADRVLFACTLSNLNSIIKRPKQDASQNENAYIKALNDTAIDRVHSELRVFDLNFGEINPATVPYYPLRWIQYHDGPDMQAEQSDGQGNSYVKNIRNISHNDAWREITATAIASGAFPFAFEPVVLNRYQHEFAQDWPQELKGKQKQQFTYVDGGMFNNEPIKEGMRLATYIDNINNHVDFDRLVIFVDPMVGELETQFRVNVHDQIGLSRSFLSGKAKVSTKSTFMRLVSKVPHVVAAILNEAQGIEMNKIASVLEQFQNRKQLREFYKATVAAPTSDQQVKQMRDFVIKELDRVRKKLDLPPNVLQIQHELIRILQEESSFFDGHLPLEDRMAMIDAIQQFVYTPVPTELPNLRYWMVALSCIALDIAMKLTGKMSNARIVPIASFNFYDKSDEYALMKLPGSGIAGFAGFASDAASMYEVRYGNYCAYRILRDLGLTGPQPEMALPPAFDYNLFNEGMKNSINRAVLKRVKEMIPSEFSTVLPFLEGLIESNLQKFISENINESSQGRSFEFRIQVKDDVCQLRGFNQDGSVSKKNTLDPVKINGNYYLVAQLTYYPKEKVWKGEQVNNEQKLFIDKLRFFENTPSVSIELPTLGANNDAFLSPNPIFLTDARGHLGISTFTEMKQGNWVLQNEVYALDESLWGKDNLHETINKMNRLYDY